ncbi:hypothetical protein PT277_03410 [Acetobacteraceae bacterium ESL0709]|nr:hypothetical protein [Acetobacteraceae bacterium ESL0697]MDF7677750.1 hypothetical protein [Acetobacteraceae bacterium ESL0709]
MSESIKSDVVFTKNGFADRDGMIMLYWFDVSGCFVREESYFIRRGLGVPANATHMAPPDAKASEEVAVFDKEKGSWSLLEDHRHDRFYMKETGQSFAGFVGPVPDYVTSQAPQSAYDKWDSAKNIWVVDEEARHQVLVNVAKETLEKTIAPQAALFQVLGKNFGVNAKNYVQKLQDIIVGNDKSSIELPLMPDDFEK